MAESALVVTVPEAERYVSGLRERFDPSARLVVPALITLLYPFAEPREIALPVLNRFEAAFAKVALSVQPDHAGSICGYALPCPGTS